MLDSFPMAVLVAAVLGFMAGLGIGGGSLLILWLTMVLGWEQQAARGTNLLFFLPSAVLCTLFRWKQGKINWKQVLPAIAAGCISSACFTAVSFRMDLGVLKKGFGLLLLAAGSRELLYRLRPENRRDT